MGGYLVNFSVYTMAMIGLIFFALMVYKKFSGDGILNKKSNFLSVEESISIAPRKNLYVVRAGNEKFLIAGDVDKTTLISKLGDTNTAQHANNIPPERSYSQHNTIEDLPDITAQRIRRNMSNQNNVLHNMVRKINY